MTLAVAPLYRLSLSAFTLALGVCDLAQLGIRSLADQALAFLGGRINRVVTRIGCVVLGSRRHV